MGELKLIADLVEERGIAGMREAISNTAELGAVLGGKRIIDDAARGAWTKSFGRSVRAGSLRSYEMRKRRDILALTEARIAARQTGLEQVFQKLNRGS